jgi:phage/plasmid-like protein (TIGR03299 family)
MTTPTETPTPTLTTVETKTQAKLASTVDGRSDILKHNFVIEPRTAEEVLEVSGLNWTTSVKSLFDETGTQLPSRFRRIVRDDTGDTLGLFRSQYQAISNRDALDFLDTLVDSGDAKYEAAWSSTSGDICGVTMSLPKGINIGGNDPFDLYILARIPHNAAGSVNICATPVRLFCTNAMMAAIKGAKQRVAIPHTANYKQKVLHAREALKLTFAYADAFEKECEELLTKSVTEGWVDEALKKIFDTDAHQTAARTTLRFSQTIPDDQRLTAYGFVNAVTEYSQHIAPRKQITPNAMFSGGVASASLKAFELAGAK